MTLHILTAASFSAVVEPALIGQRLRYYDLDYLVPLGVGDGAEESSNITLCQLMFMSLFNDSAEN